MVDPIDSLSRRLATWAISLQWKDVPEDVQALTRLRLLDMLGLALAAAQNPFGSKVRAAARALGSGPEARLLGFGDVTSAGLAALANGAMAEALQFDDTHNETIIHPTSPNAAAALALGEAVEADGEAVLTALAAAIETTCRIGLAAPGQFHGRGLHPTGIFGTFGAAVAAARLLRLDADKTVAALGHAGSFAAGLLECWTDGTETQFLHPGWAAHGGIAAARLAEAGLTGPARVIEGRFGLFRSHVQDAHYQFGYERSGADLGRIWESRRISFKPYPAAHVIHAFLDAILHLYREEGLRADAVARIEIRIASYMIGVVCEPRSEKIRPRTDAQARVSLQYSVAEALARGRLGGDGYASDCLRDPSILGLADKIEYRVDPDAPGTERYKGWVIVETLDGRRLERIEDHNLGSPEKPMTAADIEAKFRENARGLLGNESPVQLIEAVRSLGTGDPVSRLIDLSVAERKRR